MAINPALLKLLPKPIRDSVIIKQQTNKVMGPPASTKKIVSVATKSANAGVKSGNKSSSSSSSTSSPKTSSGSGGSSSPTTKISDYKSSRPVGMTITVMNPRTGKVTSYGTKNTTVEQTAKYWEDKGYTIVSTKSLAKPGGGSGPGTSYGESKIYEYTSPSAGYKGESYVPLYKQPIKETITEVKPEKILTETTNEQNISGLNIPMSLTQGGQVWKLKNQNRYVSPESIVSSNQGMMDAYKQGMETGSTYIHGSGLPTPRHSTTAREQKLDDFKERSKQIAYEMQFDKEYYAGKDAEGKPVYIYKSPYLIEHGYLPNDSDYSTQKSKLKTQLENIPTDKEIDNYVKTTKSNIEQAQTSLSTIYNSPAKTKYMIDENQDNIWDKDAEGNIKYKTREELIPLYHSNIQSMKESLTKVDNPKYRTEIKTGRTSVSNLLFMVKKHEELGYELDVKNDTYSFNLPKATKVHQWVFGEQHSAALASANLLESPLGIKSFAHGIYDAIVPGDQSKGRIEEVAAYSLNLKSGLNRGNYVAKVLTSPAMVQGVYLPTATIGLSYGLSSVGANVSSKLAWATPKLGPVSKTVLSGAGKVFGGRFATAKVTGGLFLAIEGPRLSKLPKDKIPAELGQTVFNWAMMYGSFKAGASLYKTVHPNPLPPSSKPQFIKDFQNAKYKIKNFMPRKLVSEYEKYSVAKTSWFETGQMARNYTQRQALYENTFLSNLKSKIEYRSIGYQWNLRLNESLRKTYSNRLNPPFGTTSRETTTTWEQIRGKSIDPYAPKTSSTWGGYDSYIYAQPSFETYIDTKIAATHRNVEPWNRYMYKSNVNVKAYNLKDIKFGETQINQIGGGRFMFDTKSINHPIHITGKGIVIGQEGKNTYSFFQSNVRFQPKKDLIIRGQIKGLSKSTELETLGFSYDVTKSGIFDKANAKFYKTTGFGMDINKNTVYARGLARVDTYSSGYTTYRSFGRFFSSGRSSWFTDYGKIADISGGLEFSSFTPKHSTPDTAIIKGSTTVKGFGNTAKITYSNTVKYRPPSDFVSINYNPNKIIGINTGKGVTNTIAKTKNIGISSSTGNQQSTVSLVKQYVAEEFKPFTARAFVFSQQLTTFKPIVQNAFPTLQTINQTALKTTLTPVLATGLIQSGKRKTRTLNVSSTITTNINDLGIDSIKIGELDKIEQGSLNLNMSISRTATESINDVDTLNKMKMDRMTLLGTLTAQKTEEKTNAVTISILPSSPTIQMPMAYYGGASINPSRPTPIINPFDIILPNKLFLPKFFEESNKTKKETSDTNGYNVFVKDRVYVKGKKKYETKFVKMNKKPLNYTNANNLGMAIVDNSQAATFKIKKTEGSPKQPSILIPMTNPNKFYERGDKNIERRTHRIDSLGELQQITARGWLSQQQKSLQSVNKKQTNKKLKNISFKMPTVEQSMKKMLKGLNF